MARFSSPASRPLAFYLVAAMLFSPLCLSSQPVSDQGAPASPAPVVSPAPSLSAEAMGDLHMARRRYQAALAAYDEVFPRTAALYNKMGIAYQQMYLIEKARKSYEQSLRLDPRNADVLNNLGTVYYSMKDYHEAEHLYKKALKFSPRSALIYKNLGTELLVDHKFKKGWDCYQRALTLDPQIFERDNMLRIGQPTAPQQRGAMNYYLAKSYVLAGKTDLAVQYLRMAIDQGFADRRKIMADKEFASLQGVSSFQQLLTEQRMQ